MRGNYQSESSFCVCVCIRHSWSRQAECWRSPRQDLRILGDTPAWQPMQLVKPNSTYGSVSMVTQRYTQLYLCMFLSLVSLISWFLSYILFSTFCVKGGGGDRRVSSDKLEFLCVILVCVPQSLPVFPTLERLSTRPSCQAFPLSLSARPQAAHYLVRRLTKFLLRPAVLTHRLQGVVSSDCWVEIGCTAAFLIFNH